MACMSRNACSNMSSSNKFCMGGGNYSYHSWLFLRVFSYWRALNKMKFCVFFYHVARTLGTRHDSWWMIMSVRSGIFLSWPTTAVVSYYCHGNQTYDHYTDHASSGVTPSSLRDCSRGVSEHATECAWCDHNQSHSCDIERRIIQQNDQRTDSGRSARSESKWEQSLCGWQNHHRIRTLPTSETRMGRTPVHPNFETRRNNIRIHSVRFWRKGLRPRSQGCFLRDAYPPEMRDPVQKETPAVTIKSHTRLPWYITWPRIHAVNCNVHRVKKFKSKQRLKDFLYENGFLEEV